MKAVRKLGPEIRLRPQRFMMVEDLHLKAHHRLEGALARGGTGTSPSGSVNSMLASRILEAQCRKTEAWSKVGRLGAQPREQGAHLLRDWPEIPKAGTRRGGESRSFQV